MKKISKVLEITWQYPQMWISDINAAMKDARAASELNLNLGARRRAQIWARKVRRSISNGDITPLAQ